MEFLSLFPLPVLGFEEAPGWVQAIWMFGVPLNILVIMTYIFNAMMDDIKQGTSGREKLLFTITRCHDGRVRVRCHIRPGEPLGDEAILRMLAERQFPPRRRN